MKTMFPRANLYIRSSPQTHRVALRSSETSSLHQCVFKGVNTVVFKLAVCVCVEVKWTLMEIGRVFLHVGSAWAFRRERRSSQMPFPLKPWLKSWKPPTAQQRNEGKMGFCHAGRIRPLYCRDGFHRMEKELHPGVVLFQSKESHFLSYNARFGLMYNSTWKGGISNFLRGSAIKRQWDFQLEIRDSDVTKMQWHQRNMVAPMYAVNEWKTFAFKNINWLKVPT